MANIAFFCQDGDDKFVRDIMAWLGQTHTTRAHNVHTETSDDAIRATLDWADLSWAEFVGPWAVHLSRMPRRGRLLCRLHSNEAFTSAPSAVRWENVDGLIFVAEHIRSVCERFVPDLRRRVRTHIIPNGVDMQRFTLRKNHQPTHQYAFVGALRHTKNLPLLLQCFQAIHAREPGAVLHLAGAFQSLGADLDKNELALYLEHMIHAMGLNRAVQFHGQVSDINGFLQDKDALISASLRESFGYNIAEAMAKGVKPLVHHFPGAEAVYPPEILFATVEECARKALDEPGLNPLALRSYIAKRYSLEAQQKALAPVMETLLG